VKTCVSTLARLASTGLLRLVLALQSLFLDPSP